MADKIKNYFKKKKADAKFKLAGPGHRLTEEPQPRAATRPQTVPTRGAPSAEARQAAAAALARLDGQRQDHAAFNTSMAAIQAQVRREMEAEKKARESSAQSSRTSQPVDLEASAHLAVSGVFFKCSMIGPEVLSREEWNKKIREFLYEQLEEERGLTACLIIQTCNKNREKVEMCIETLSKYLENIMVNPTEEKYRKIRLSNRVYQERVAPVEGAIDFLIGAGFVIQNLPHQNGTEEFFVYPEEQLADLENLQIMYDALQAAEPMGLELDRNLQVLLPSQVSQRMELPPVFFNITAEELKREQQLRLEAAEKRMMLRTKAMREKDEQRELRRYRYALLRIRFPDGVFLQGTFSVYEKLEAVKNFVVENIVDDSLPFQLVTATGHKLMEDDYDQTLLDLRLVPASVLIFSWDSPGAIKGEYKYLKPEVMILMQTM